ncbi:RNA polymerase sigma factor [Posidoniimonas polymericola]|uniref:RNA polymerase sigma factor n=1 Tax=Posidoniimonas polymericola TaxID=2528002 RepID=A0A5C5YH22_9BACT|nr:sigma-70 family RNA polymerase sigma factor [Posidoniimonas polymericola]TWT74524.1 RNA polymerase sigma factor [Posidoniimonas polymericola]
MSEPNVKQQPAVVGEEFVQLLTGEQLRLLHYITMLLSGDVNAAENVLQETNLVLWRKASEFAPGTSFRAWSRTVAQWQVQAYLRDRGRDRHVFSLELMSQLASRDNEFAVQPETRGALRDCLKNLGQTQFDLLNWRYEDGLPIRKISARAGKSEVAVRSSLQRIRRILLSCIESKIAAG